MTKQSYRFFVEHAYNQFFTHSSFLNSARSKTVVKEVGRGGIAGEISTKIDGYTWMFVEKEGATTFVSKETSKGYPVINVTGEDDDEIDEEDNVEGTLEVPSLKVDVRQGDNTFTPIREDEHMANVIDAEDTLDAEARFVRQEDGTFVNVGTESATWENPMEVDYDPDLPENLGDEEGEAERPRPSRPTSGPEAQLHDIGEFVLSNFSSKHQRMIRQMVRHNALAMNLLDDPEEAAPVPDDPDHVSAAACLLMFELIEYEGFNTFMSVVVPTLDLRVDYDEFHELK